MKRFLTPALVFAVALGVRLFYLGGVEAYPKFELIRNRLDDQVVFDLWAKSIVAGERFDYSTTGHHFARWAAQSPGVYPQAPLYPFFLATLYEVFGLRYDLVRVVQMALGALACGLVYLLALRWLSPAAATLSALALAFYGPVVFYEGTFLRAGVFTLVAVAGLWLLTRAADGAAARRPWLALATGTALSAGVLLRPNYLLVAVLALGWLYSVARRADAVRARARRVLLFGGLGLVAPLLPVVAVNSIRSGGPAFLSSNGPYIFFISNVHDAPGTTAGISRYYREVRDSGPPEEVDLFGEALRDVARHPGAFLRLQARKAVHFFAPRESPNNLSYEMGKETNPRLRVAFVELYLLLPLAAAGLFVSLREPRRYLPLYLFLGGYWLGTVVFYVLARLRQPVVPVLAVFAGVALEAGWRLARERRWPALAAAALAVVGATLLLRPGAPLHRPADYQMASAAYVSLGQELAAARRPDGARRALARAVALNPEHEGALARLARLGARREPAAPEAVALCEEARREIEAGRIGEAKGLLERAIELAPGAALPYQYLANGYYLEGDRGRALRALERAVELDPMSAVNRQNLRRLRQAR